MRALGVLWTQLNALRSPCCGYAVRNAAARREIVEKSGLALLLGHLRQHCSQARPLELGVDDPKWRSLGGASQVSVAQEMRPCSLPIRAPAGSRLRAPSGTERLRASTISGCRQERATPCLLGTLSPVCKITVCSYQREDRTHNGAQYPGC